jgi:hypothetical protein
MKRHWIRNGCAALFFSAVLCAGWSMASAQDTLFESDGNPPPARERVEFERVGMSGPRFGVTWIPGDNELTRELKEEGMEPLLSQFGWHFERRVSPRGGGPEFVIETVPMVAGVEYGKVIPNITVAMGVRFPAGWEFGIGPNLLLTGIENSDDIQTSLVTAVGYSFRYSGVSLPVNLAFTTNPDGNRVSLVFGYAIRR